MVAHDARKTIINFNERRTSMATYTVVIYVAFGVFLATIFILNTTFLPNMEEAGQQVNEQAIEAGVTNLPATIQSRCSKIPFTALSLGSCRTILKDSISEDAIELTARLTMGRPGLAVSADIKEDRDWFMSLFKAKLRAEKDGWASREETEKWIDLALTFMRDLAVLKITGRRDLLINIDLGDSIERLGKSVEPQRIIDMYKELNFIRATLLFNLNKSLTWNYTAVLLRKELVSQND